jgi:hypothetical protein
MRIDIECTREEQRVIQTKLRDNGYAVVVERDISGMVSFTFKVPVTDVIKALIKQAIRENNIRNLGDYDILNILNYTPAQIEAYITTNVTTLTQAKNVLIILAKLNLYLLKRLARDI